MKDYFINKNSPFDGLVLKQVKSFLTITNQTSRKDIDYIKRRYLESSDNFEITFKFLYEIGAIILQNNKIYSESSCNKYLGVEDKANFIRELLNLIIKKNNNYRAEIITYLKYFEIFGDGVTYRPDFENRGHLSGVRNFLMELGIISYDKQNDRYNLSQNEYKLFVFAKNDCTLITPSKLAVDQKAKNEIGHMAELAVLAYEKNRIGKEYAHRIKHIATYNVAAGYDIESFSYNADGTLCPRYIEVKAVPSDSYCFYWTANERNVAKIFKSWYFLYLIPVFNGINFDFDKIKIISDPYYSILSTESDWIVEDSVIMCYLPHEFKSSSD